MLHSPRLSRVVLCLLTLAAYPRIGHAQPTVPPGFEDISVANVPVPTALATTPDGRLLITSQLGQLYIYEHGALIETPALDLSATVCAYRERGMLGLAVDPQFATNHFIYITHSFNKYGNCDAETPEPTPVNRLSRFVLADDNTVSLDSERVLIDNLPSTIGVHNLDDVEFGKDELLYVSIGDGGCDYAADSGCFSSNDAARDMHALIGKVLRITRDGDIPAGNPFTGPGTVRCATSFGQPGQICQEIFATGFRNPWRLVFDPNAPATRFFINDVGQDTWEEINEGIAGADYGWNVREGDCARDSMTDCSAEPPAGLTNPVFAYAHVDGCSSITGGAFVPNGVWPADFDGVYLFSDYVCGSIFKLVRNADGSFTRDVFISNLGGSSATDMYFSAGAAGVGLYYTTYAGGGEVRRIISSGDANRRPTAILTGSPTSGLTPLTVNFDASGSSDPDRDPLVFNWDFGDGVTLESGSTTSHTYTVDGTYNATVRVVDPIGASATASLRIDAGNTAPRPVIITPAANARFAVGDVITLQGRASDSEDGDLPESSLTWRVVLHHNTHTHGFLPPTNGNGITFRAPGPENLQAAATSYLDVELTATDSKGLQSTIVQPLMPSTATITFLSDPQGANLRIEDSLVATPVSYLSWVNFPVSVEAPPQTGTDGSTLVFASWSDGGSAAHTIVTPTNSTSYTATFTRETSASTPFGGSPAALPGRIEAENFDEGGEEVAYHDDSPGNAGGEYRATNVDVEGTADTGGGFDLGWTFAGEWLNYTVNVAEGGAHAIDVRVASAGAGGTFHLEVNGSDVTGRLTVPDTGGWQSWTTIHVPAVMLNAGVQLWRLVMDTNGATSAVGNFNWINVTRSTSASTPFGGSPAALPGRIEAENFDEGGGAVAYHDDSAGNAGGEYRATNVDVEGTVDVEGGFDIGWAFAGEWLNYTVNVAASGTHAIDVRVASAGAGGTFHLEVNGSDVTGRLTVPDTGGWQSWTTIHVPAVTLNAGVQIWRLVMDTNGATTAVGNFNWINVTRSTSASTPFGGSPTALPGRIEAENFDDGAEAVAYHDDSTGNAGGEYRATNVDVEGTVDTDGGFDVGWAFAGEWLNYTVNVAAAGSYDIDVRVASEGAGGTFHLEVNGSDVTGRLTVPDTGGWQSWTTIHVPAVTLNAGVQIWRLVMDTNGATSAVANFNWIAMTPP